MAARAAAGRVAVAEMPPGGRKAADASRFDLLTNIEQILAATHVVIGRGNGGPTCPLQSR